MPTEIFRTIEQKDKASLLEKISQFNDNDKFLVIQSIKDPDLKFNITEGLIKTENLSEEFMTNLTGLKINLLLS